MTSWWPFRKRKPSVREVSLSAIPTQTIAKDREQARLATINGLLAGLPEPDRSRVQAKFAAIAGGRR